MMIGYRVDLAADDNGSLLVTCPQLPMVATFGETREDALSHARDAIETALASMIDDGEKIPRPKAADLAKDDGLTVRLPALTALKVQLVWALEAAGITRAELARRLKWNREFGRPPVPARSPLAAGAARGGFQGARPPGRRRGQGGSLSSRPQWHGTELGDSIAACASKEKP